MKAYTDEIINTINKYIPKNDDEWQFLGFINRRQDIYAFGSDSKIIGRLFEVVVVDALSKAAQDLNYVLHESHTQTVYPDFYFEKPDGKRIAVDIKTTYRRSKSAKYGFTGGSFTSFMRNGTKNIDGNYSDYEKHYILGIVYTREETPFQGKTELHNLDSILPAYRDVECFVQEKYRICGDKKGSGNTDNIGTIKYNTIKPFEYGAGPFAFLGKEVFLDYWTNHPKYTDSDQVKKALFNDLPSYFSWVKKSDPQKADTLSKKYSEYLAFTEIKNQNNWQ